MDSPRPKRNLLPLLLLVIDLILLIWIIHSCSA